MALFNEGDNPATISTNVDELGLPQAKNYRLRDLWAHTTTETNGSISAIFPVHGVAMYRISDHP